MSIMANPISLWYRPPSNPAVAPGAIRWLADIGKDRIREPGRRRTGPKLGRCPKRSAPCAKQQAEIRCRKRLTGGDALTLMWRDGNAQIATSGQREHVLKGSIRPDCGAPRNCAADGATRWRARVLRF